MSQAQVHICGTPENLSERHATLFRDFGKQAWTFIAMEHEMEEAERQYWIDKGDWRKLIMQRAEDQPEPFDEDVDMGFEEPDDYGE